MEIQLIYLVVGVICIIVCVLFYVCRQNGSIFEDQLTQEIYLNVSIFIKLALIPRHYKGEER